MQWADNSPLAEASLFGASSFVAADGKTAQIADSSPARHEVVQRRRLEGPLHPQPNQINSDLLAKGNEFQSGNLAMAETHTWYTCCINPAAPAKPIVTTSAGPSLRRTTATTTAKLHADTFSILKTTKHPDEAFTALAAMVDSGELLADYGAFPADPALQQAYIDTVNKQYPKAQDRLGRAAGRCSATWTTPTIRPGCPNYAKARTALQAFRQQVPDHRRASTSMPSWTR